jgi:membrane protein implicated in regulation of membrane protease activity
MPDNWAYVFAAYLIAGVAVVWYWRHLARRARELAELPRRKKRGTG